MKRCEVIKEKNNLCLFALAKMMTNFVSAEMATLLIFLLPIPARCRSNNSSSKQKVSNLLWQAIQGTAAIVLLPARAVTAR